MPIGQSAAAAAAPTATKVVKMDDKEARCGGSLIGEFELDRKFEGDCEASPVWPDDKLDGAPEPILATDSTKTGELA